MIIKEKIEMKSLKRERDIIIYVPDDYLTSKKDILFYLLMMDKMRSLMKKLILVKVGDFLKV